MPIDLGSIPGPVWTISTNKNGDANAVLMTAADGGGQGWVPYRKLNGGSWEQMPGWGGVIVTLSDTTSRALVIGRKGGPCWAYDINNEMYMTNTSIHHVTQGMSGKIIATQSYGGQNHQVMEKHPGEPIRFNVGHVPKIDGHIVALTKNDSLWITNNIGQLWEYDRPAGTLSHRLSGISWVAVGYDDSVWALSSGNGVYKKNGDKWDFYPISNGRSIHAAPDNELLIVTTSNQVVRLDGSYRFTLEPMVLEVMDEVTADDKEAAGGNMTYDFIPRI